MRETSLPLTTPLPELSEKFDLLFNAWTKSVKEITFGLFCFGFFLFIKFVSKIVLSRSGLQCQLHEVDGVAKNPGQTIKIITRHLHDINK